MSRSCDFRLARISAVLPVAGLAANLALMLACAPESKSPGARVAPTTESAKAGLEVLASARIVDLSHSYDESTIYWPTSPSEFELERLSYGHTDAGFFYAANSFRTPEHGGTHLDAPIHFAEGRQTVDEIPLERLVGPGIVIDVTRQAAEDRDYRLTLEDVHAWEKAYGRVPKGSIVLLRTGWSERWPDRGAYMGDDTPGDASRLHFPSYGLEAAEYLVETRGVAALGVDTASIDHGPSTDFLVHQLANSANVSGLENVANLGALPETGAWIIALPLKITGGSGSPARIVALLP